MSETAPSILIVDDRPVGLEVLEGILTGEGYHLLLARTGQEALTKARAWSPDAILLDIMMPGMDGFEVCRRLRADPQLSEVPILLVTALSDRDSLLRGLEAGADDFISKPIDRRELRARIRTIVRLNRYRLLLAERAKVERLINLSPDGILVVDAGWNLCLTNPALLRMLRCEEDDPLIGRSLWNFVTPQEVPYCRVFLHQVLQQEVDSAHLESRFLRSDGEVFPVELTAGFISWNDRPCFEMLVRDATHRKRLEEEIQRGQRLDAIGRTSSEIAHDFNKYLDAIRLHAQLILRGTPEAEKAQAIVEATEQAAGLTRQLLAFARQQEIHPQLLDLNAVIEDMRPILQQQLLDRTVELSFSLTEVPLSVLADKVQLQQIVLNLLTNARDAIAEDGLISIRTSRVELDIARARQAPGASPGEYALMEVVDSGHGMTPETQAKIFEPFFTTKGEKEGTGLGLSTVYGTVRQSHGHIRVESEPDLGTKMKVFLPFRS